MAAMLEQPEERGSRAVFWWSGAAIALLLALRFLPAVENPFAIEPRAAHVALLAAGERVAADGEHRLEAGRGFTLYAVLEAADWRGRTRYFTAAPALRLGGAAIPAEAIAPYAGGQIARVRWFTVEGFAPYLEVAREDDLDRFRLNENFHPEWGESWRVEGRVDPRLALLEPDSPLAPLPFGTQRFHARIELFESAGALTPEVRLASPGAAAALAGEPRVTRVVAALPGRLGPISAALGRVQVEAVAELPAPLAARVEALAARDLAFDRARLLAAHLARAGVAARDLVWRPVDLAGGALGWGREVAAGDLVQVGARVAVLFRDQGVAGKLDPADLAFDLGRGLRIRRLEEIFTGEAGLEVEFAALGAAPSARAAP
jgi:hypothetical protein